MMSDFHTENDGVLSWTAHPAAERPTQAVLATVVILAVSAAVWFSFDSAIWGAGAAVILFVGLNRFFLPSRFTIDQQGIFAKYPLTRKRARWQTLQRFVHDEHGGFLSSRAAPSRLDAYRGLHLLFGPHDGPQRDRIIARIETHMARRRAAVQPKAHRPMSAAAMPGEAAA